MDNGIETTKKGYLLAVTILAIGGLIFYYLVLQNINLITHLVDEVIPGESITIDAGKNEEYYILIDTISRDYVSVYPNSSTTDVTINKQGSIYNFIFYIYEEDNSSNTVVATELQGTTRIVIDQHEVFLVVTFIEAGTYIIETTSDQVSIPSFTFGVAKVSPWGIIFSLAFSLVVFIVTLILSLMIFSKTRSKIAKAIEEYNNQNNYKSKDNFDIFDNY